MGDLHKSSGPRLVVPKRGVTVFVLRMVDYRKPRVVTRTRCRACQRVPPRPDERNPDCLCCSRFPLMRDKAHGDLE